MFFFLQYNNNVFSSNIIIPSFLRKNARINWELNNPDKELFCFHTIRIWSLNENWRKRKQLEKNKKIKIILIETWDIVSAFKLHLMFGVYLSFLHKNLSILIVDLYYPSLSIVIVQTPGAQLVSVCVPASPARPTQTQHTQIFQICQHTQYVFANLQIHRQNTTHNSMCIKSKNTKNTQAQHKQHNINVCFKFTNTRTKQIYSLVSNTMERYF